MRFHIRDPLSPPPPARSDIASLYGKSNMAGLGFRSGDPQLKEVLDLEDKLEKESWDGDNHDADGVKKKTVAAWARDNLPH